jgi:hypothetical protein
LALGKAEYAARTGCAKLLSQADMGRFTVGEFGFGKALVPVMVHYVNLMHDLNFYSARFSKMNDICMLNCPCTIF